MALKRPRRAGGEVLGPRTALHHNNEPKAGFSPPDQLRITPLTSQKGIGSAAQLARRAAGLARLLGPRHRHELLALWRALGCAGVSPLRPLFLYFHERLKQLQGTETFFLDFVDPGI